VRQAILDLLDRRSRSAGEQRAEWPPGAPVRSLKLPFPGYQQHVGRRRGLGNNGPRRNEWAAPLASLPRLFRNAFSLRIARISFVPLESHMDTFALTHECTVSRILSYR
jgi:hypothetical protein